MTVEDEDLEQEDGKEEEGSTHAHPPLPLNYPTENFEAHERVLWRGRTAARMTWNSMPCESAADGA